MAPVLDAGVIKTAYLHFVIATVGQRRGDGPVKTAAAWCGRGSHSISNFRFAIFGLVVATFAEKILQNCCTLILQNARRDLALMI